MTTTTTTTTIVDYLGEDCQASWKRFRSERRSMEKNIVSWDLFGDVILRTDTCGLNSNANVGILFRSLSWCENYKKRIKLLLFVIVSFIETSFLSDYPLRRKINFPGSIDLDCVFNGALSTSLLFVWNTQKLNDQGGNEPREERRKEEKRGETITTNLRGRNVYRHRVNSMRNTPEDRRRANIFDERYQFTAGSFVYWKTAWQNEPSV